MVKRRATVESDNESSDAEEAPASKRARTNDGSDDEPSAAGRERGPKRANGGGRRKDDSDSEDDDNEALGQAEEDEFEKENRDKIMAAIEAKRHLAGGIAEQGIIESIEMHQFMCHKYLVFHFGPQMNFIIGHNGSGKSAVLSAVMVALGGKIGATGRGSGLKQLIREGQSTAEVTISIKNQGEDAYKPAEYGDSIVITRRFTVDGSSTWKIKSKDGHVISTKREELSSICDHMNIQVDNPLNVLTQDSARMFLSASHPHDKYKFFLRGTQLSQLSEEYETCLENITTTTKVLQHKKDALPDLEAAFNDAKQRFEEASKAREQKAKADDLKRELAWAHVKHKELEMAAKFSEVAKLEAKVPKIQEALTAAETEMAAASADVEQYEAEHKNLGSIDHINQQRQELKDKISNNKHTLQSLNNDTKDINRNLSQINNQIEDFEEKIDEENRRLAGDGQEKREETRRRLQEAKEAVEEAQSATSRLAEEQRTTQGELDELQSRGQQHEEKVSGLQKEIMNCDSILQRCGDAEKNKYAAFGHDIQKVLDQIKKMKWRGDDPLGPLGMYVQARDPQKWGDLLRSQLSGSLLAFAVTDSSDLKQLKRLLMESKNGHMVVFFVQKDLFDYSAGEPDPSILTVLRALDISNEYVKRILINQGQIERVVLAETRKEGEAILRGTARGGTAWTHDGRYLRRYPEGGESTGPLNTRVNPAFSLLLTGNDAAAQGQRYYQKKQELTQEYHDVVQQRDSIKQEWTAKRQHFESLKRQDRSAHQRLAQAKRQVSDLQQEVNNDMPANISGLESAKQDLEQEKANYLEQFEEVAKQKAAIGAENKDLLSQSNELKKLLDDFEARSDAVRTKVEEAVSKRMEAQNKIKHYQGKLDEENAKVKAATVAADDLKEEFENWTAKATEYCDPVPNPRKVDVIDRHLKSVQEALKEREKRHGASVEEMTIEVNKTRQRLEEVQKDLKQMTSLNKLLRNSLKTRLSRWQEFRRHIALRCKVVFQYHLSVRGYFGKVLFDHHKEQLHLKVQTDDLAGTQAGSREKDPRSLSGGEKSFSTICLLLSLWESIGCPLRCLDEFDVFMDAVNRRISMKMMIDTANQSDKKQYILITPQDMSNIHVGPTVKVNRMPDPERGQGILNF